MKTNYFVIPLAVIVVAVLGSILTGADSMVWYNTLVKPRLTPPDWAFPLAWTTIFFLSAVSAIMAYNKSSGSLRSLIVGLFIVNGILNIAWSWFFFKLHLIGPALMEMVLLEASVIMLMVVVWRFSKVASWLLAPYAVWVGFATYLTFEIMRLN